MAMNEIDDEDVIDTSEAEAAEAPTACVRCGREDTERGADAICVDAADCWEAVAMDAIEERDGLVNAVARAEKERDQLRDGYRRELSVNGQLRTALDSARKQSDEQLARRLHSEKLSATLVDAAGEKLLGVLDALDEARATAYEEIRKQREAKDQAYNERNCVVAALARAIVASGGRAWVAKHPEADTTLEPDWRTILFVELPTGQASWHFHDSEVELLEGIPSGDGAWDGHTTPEKYARLARAFR